MTASEKLRKVKLRKAAWKAIAAAERMSRAMGIAIDMDRLARDVAAAQRKAEKQKLVAREVSPWRR